MEMNIGISEENRQKVALELSKLLADQYVLYTKTKEAHWNVEGIDFSDKHKLFEKQAEQISGSIDSVAERVRTREKSAIQSEIDPLISFDNNLNFVLSN